MASWPAQSLVALSRQIENGGIAAFICAPSSDAYARRGVRSATTGIRRAEARAIEMPHVAARQK
jgi:hypothetical protein